MTSEAREIAGNMRREMLRNIAIAPVVLLVRLPLALVFVSLEWVCAALEWGGGYLPGFRLDYYRYLKRHRAELERQEQSHDR